MSRFIAQNFPGYGSSESRCLPCSGVSGRAVTVCPCSSRINYRLHSYVKFGYINFSSREPPFVCKMSSGGRRNSDFSKQNRNGFSRSRNRENEGRDEKVEESDLLSSKIGPIVSLSNTPKFQATATPGPREKEIVELFRKVQAQLREIAAMKKEKKIEALQGQTKESETVDSLLNLLRKHSAEQGKRTSDVDSSRDFILDHPEESPKVNGNNTSPSILGSISSMLDETEESNVTSLTRPVSNFRRKSPVPRVKFQVDNSSEETVNYLPHLNLDGKGNTTTINTNPKPAHEPESEPESLPEPQGNLSDGDAYDEISEDDDIAESVNKEQTLKDFNALKLPELKALAKSLGTKGFSKMKKRQLVELLTRAQSNQ